VTQEQWQAVMGSNPSFFTGDLSRPVEQVSWNDIQGGDGFLKKLNALLSLSGTSGFRLPTEAEWEKAARAGTTTPFSFGAPACDYQCGDCSADSYVWWCANSGGTTHPVGRKLANSYGLYDMHGNLYEYCQDFHAEYPTSPPADYAGPSTGSIRVFRGGNFFNALRYSRSSYRGGGVPDARYSGVGLRLARSQ
jgi:formylglycine-generating enzyme required for sulfatase activity